MNVSVAAILTAAGSGSRLGLGYPKALAHLAACPLVGHAARRLSEAGVAQIVVTAPLDNVHEVEAALQASPGIMAAWRVVPGGASRQASVSAGLAALAAVGPFDVVLVHDAARPLAPTKLMVRIIEAVSAGAGAVVPALAVTDTIKTVEQSELAVGAPHSQRSPARVGQHLEQVTGTVDRTLLRAVQTPQGFAWDLLVRAHAAGAHRADNETTAATDDAALVEALGEPVWIIDGDTAALKITTTHDLAIAEVLLRNMTATPPVADRPNHNHPEDH